MKELELELELGVNMIGDASELRPALVEGLATHITHGDVTEYFVEH